MATIFPVVSLVKVSAATMPAIMCHVLGYAGPCAFPVFTSWTTMARYAVTEPCTLSVTVTLSWQAPPPGTAAGAVQLGVGELAVVRRPQGEGELDGRWGGV